MSRRKRWILYAFLALVLLVAVAYSYFFHLGGMERAINSRISALLGDDSPVLIRVGRVKGNLLSGVVVNDISVVYCDSVTAFRMMSIPRLTAGYSFSNLWNKRFLFDFLYVDSAHVVVVRDSTGRTILPLSGGGGEGGGGAMQFAIDNLHLNKCRLDFVGQEDTVEVRDLVVSCSVKSEEGQHSILIKQISFDSNLEDVRLSAASGGLTVSGSEIFFQDFTLISGETRLKTSGHLNLADNSGRIDFSADQFNLQSVTRHIGPRLKGILDLNGFLSFDSGELEGSVDLGGDFMIASLENLHVNFHYEDKYLALDTLYGTVLGSCAIDGAAGIDFTRKPEAYELHADLRNFNLDNLVRNTFQSDLTGRVDLRGKSFRKADMALNLDVELSESSFDEYPLQNCTGSVLITTDSILFRDGFTVDYFENRFRAEGVIVYSGEIDLSVDIELPNLDRYREKLFIDQPGGRGRVYSRLTGATGDPDLSGRFVSDSLWLYGMYADSAVADFIIARFLTGRQGYVHAMFYDGEAWRIPYDTAFTRITLDSTVAYIDTAYIGNIHAGASSHGKYDYGVYPQALVLDTLRLTLLQRIFFNRLPLRIGIDSAGFNFEQATIGNETAQLSVAGRIDYDETMDMELSVEHVPIAPWLRLINEELPVDGYVSCEADLHGNFAGPRFELQGAIDSLTYRNLVLGDLSLRAEYADQRMTVDSFMIDAHPGTYQASGYFGLDLAFTADSIERIPDQPFDIQFKAQDERFDLVTLFMPLVEQLDGDFSTDMHLSGTPSEPHLNGSASLRSAALKYYDLADTLYTDSATITMRDNRIIVDSVIAYVKDGRSEGPGSYALIAGVITVKTLDNFHYDLDITFPEEFPFEYDLDDIDGVVKGNLQVQGDTPPRVTGDLTLMSTMYRVNFASEEEGSPIMTAFSGEDTWDLNINIDIVSKYWIKNDDIDAEFGGYVNLIRENGKYRFVGEMEILRGRGFLFDKTFRIEPYSRVVFEGTEYPNPRLDITACTRIPGVRFEEEERPDLTELCVQVGGTLENPEFNTTAEDTTFTREDILPLIVANYYGGQNGSSDQPGSSGLFQDRVTQLISSQVSRIGSKQLSQLGVETFEIDPSYGGSSDLSDTRVTLGFYTGSNLYIYGRSTLSGHSGQALGFEYRFSRSLLLEGRRDEDELYHVNLNLHWEF